MAAKKRKDTPRKNPGALALVGGMMIASALVRLALGADEVLAKVDTPTEPRHMLPSERDAASEAANADIARVLNALKKRESGVRKREQNLLVREKSLDVAEEEIKRQLAQLAAAEDGLKKTIEIASTAAEKDLGTLTEVYANMKPKQASSLFEKMDPRFAAGFLARMAPENAAKIMAGLTPDAAYVISVQLAGRNARAPKN